MYELVYAGASGGDGSGASPVFDDYLASMWLFTIDQKIYRQVVDITSVSIKKN
jgi:hypothetical protein